MKSNSRYLGALIIAPFVIFIYLGGIPLKLFTLAIALMGVYEFYNALKVKEFKPLNYVGYILIVLYYLFSNDISNFSYILILATVLMLCIPVVNLEVTFIDIALTILGFIYVGGLFGFIPMVSDKVGGRYLVWLIFFGSWGCDTLAFYCGKYLGKRKLCPKVSPKKTIEGSIGGIIGSTLLCGIFGIIVGKYIPQVPVIHFFLIGSLCGIMGQFGDLIASSIKRYVGIKDYSNLIPGHGGILDRFDSILFNAVVVFYYLTFIVGI